MMDDISTVFLYLFLSPYQTHTLFLVDPMAMEELVLFLARTSIRTIFTYGNSVSSCMCWCEWTIMIFLIRESYVTLCDKLLLLSFVWFCTLFRLINDVFVLLWCVFDFFFGNILSPSKILRRAPNQSQLNAKFGPTKKINEKQRAKCKTCCFSTDTPTLFLFTTKLKQNAVRFGTECVSVYGNLHTNVCISLCYVCLCVFSFSHSLLHFISDILCCVYAPHLSLLYYNRNEKFIQIARAHRKHWTSTQNTTHIFSPNGRMNRWDEATVWFAVTKTHIYYYCWPTVVNNWRNVGNGTSQQTVYRC